MRDRCGLQFNADHIRRAGILQMKVARELTCKKTLRLCAPTSRYVNAVGITKVENDFGVSVGNYFLLVNIARIILYDPIRLNEVF